jgi:hypothetical protein
MNGIVLAWFIVNWLATLTIFYHVFFHSAAAFKYAGTSKLRWFFVAVGCIVVPVGLPMEIYFWIRWSPMASQYDHEKLAAREAKRARDAERRRAEDFQRQQIQLQTHQLQSSMKHQVQQELHNKGYN